MSKLSKPPRDLTTHEGRKWLESITATAGGWAGPQTGYTETRDIDPATATLPDVIDVLCTLLADLKASRGISE